MNRPRVIQNVADAQQVLRSLHGLTPEWIETVVGVRQPEALTEAEIVAVAQAQLDADFEKSEATWATWTTWAVATLRSAKSRS